MKVHRDTAIRMRYDGYTYQEIAERYGTSRQWIQQMLAGTKTRKSGAIFDNIPYKGLYTLFFENEKLSIPKLAGMIWEHPIAAHNQILRNLLEGEREPKFTLSELQRICDICGMTFEETFERRDGK